MRPHLVLAALCAAMIPSFASLGTAQTYHPASDAPVDPALSAAANGALLAFPGSITDFVRSGGGQFVELPDGTARLTCRVFSQSNLYQAFLVDIQFTGRVDPGAPTHPPANGPTLGLLPTAYTSLGGPIAPSSFWYYTGATGTLVGVRNLTGARVELTAANPVQVGVGANNHNGHLGLFGEFTVNVLSQAPWNPVTPTGNALLSLDLLAAPLEEATTHPQIFEGITTLPEGRALALAGVADDYVFVPSAVFRELSDGTATLAGKLARLGDLSDGWDLTLALSGRVDPGQAAWPPAGSPVLQLLPSAYATNGGDIDPGHWHYYTGISGTLTGTGINAGGAIDLAPATAMQVGGGANQFNTYFGFHARLQATLVTQPAGRVLALGGGAELHGLTASFPVLPFPTLTVAPVPPQVPVVSGQGLVLQGDNLAWIGLIGLDGALIGRGDASSFVHGWFEVIDNTHVEVHVAPSTTPGLHNLIGFNPATATNTIAIDVVHPLVPVLVGEPSVGAQETIHLRCHHGAVTGPALSLMVLSQTLGASSLPGFVDLEIGAGFTDVLVDPNIYSHDPVTGLAAVDYGPLSAALLGVTFHFEGAIVDIGTQALPLATTNAWTVSIE